MNVEGAIQFSSIHRIEMQIISRRKKRRSTHWYSFKWINSNYANWWFHAFHILGSTCAMVESELQWNILRLDSRQSTPCIRWIGTQVSALHREEICARRELQLILMEFSISFHVFHDAGTVYPSISKQFWFIQTRKASKDCAMCSISCTAIWMAQHQPLQATLM